MACLSDVGLERETYQLFTELRDDITLTISMAKHQSNNSALQRKLDSIISRLKKLRTSITKLVQQDKANSIEGQTRF